MRPAERVAWATTAASFAPSDVAVRVACVTHQPTPATIEAPNVGIAAARAMSMVEIMSPRTVVMRSRKRPRTAAMMAMLVWIR
ncbi:hypothetical protein VSH64_44280 [Amycolatopsis rhabdoformis]|uniref:Uncharacterized protein n=1 Tax=Amycolatopsis rhabdoformis TaxID=1448059 RepID=A0ABZ1I6Z3_9PSEU|nr:hypothetical protein [Amycolatopsis rhabdoformis]WSE29736.1 hypothetical protein VSH64_44280 [Amycolatopsis rhabdoformis]